MLNIEILYDSAIPPLIKHLRERKASTQVFVHKHSSHHHLWRSEIVETIHMSISRWMDKQNTVYPSNGMLFGNKKEWRTDTLAAAKALR